MLNVYEILVIGFAYTSTLKYLHTTVSCRIQTICVVNCIIQNRLDKSECVIQEKINKSKIKSKITIAYIANGFIHC